MNNQKKPINDQILRNVLDIVREKGKDELASEEKRNTARLQTEMLRVYLKDPAINYSACRKIVQTMIPEVHLSDTNIRIHAERMRISERTVRAKLIEWAIQVTEQIREGMTGDGEAIDKAKTMILEKFSPSEKHRHDMQNAVVLTALFEFIPELAVSEERNDIPKFGKTYRNVCLKNILDSIAYDIAESNVDPEIEKLTNVGDLRKKIYMARNELQEYRSLVEAAYYERDSKLEEFKHQEIASFFSALNDEQHGYLIDSLYLLKKACAEYKKSGEVFPYLLEGIPAFFDRLLGFLCEAGISPACKFAPHSIQKLTLDQMDGCRFEPLPERKTPIKEGEAVTVKVISSGWKYGETVISYPVLQEECPNKN